MTENVGYDLGTLVLAVAISVGTVSVLGLLFTVGFTLLFASWRKR